eukprot:scaffold73115_cov37-Cyclotella_meneghiniana.AAC.2
MHMWHCRDGFEREMRITGLTRKTILSPAWHKKHPLMANHLFGFEKWEYFKTIVKYAFVGHDIDTEYVKGEGDIAPLEKICMCIMLARRAYLRQTFCGIYDRAPGSITNYLKEWVPVLGRIGKY